MENFMDRLGDNGIGSQDIIRANAQAEAMEAARTRQEAEQYKVQLEELRRSEEEHRKAIDDANEQLALLSRRIDENDVRIHDVGVQIYRNVQAVVEKTKEEEKQHLKTLEEMIEGSNVDVVSLIRKIEKNYEEIRSLEAKLETIQVGVETKNSAVTPLVIITMLLVAADLAFNILVRLGII